MSLWIAGLAYKIRDLLNKVDQNAAMALHTAGFPVNPGMDTLTLEAFQIALRDVIEERDELRTSLELLNPDNENIELRQRAQKLESLTSTLSEERDKAIQELQEAQTAHALSKSALEGSLAHKLQVQIKETDRQRRELQESQVKAQQALLAKDALIAELKTTHNAEDAGLQHQLKFDALKQELQQANEELEKLRLQLDDCIIQQQQHELDKAVAHQREQALSAELQSVGKYKTEQPMLTQLLISVRQQLNDQMHSSATRLQLKEKQLQTLRQQQTESGITNAKTEYEKRLKALTQSLVERQGEVEQLTSERNALRLQHENMEELLKLKSQANCNNNAKTDSVDIRISALLFRFPFMTMFIILYMALLHFWVMFVLLQETPN